MPGDECGIDKQQMNASSTASDSNQKVKTRYSFYEAGDSDSHLFINSGMKDDSPADVVGETSTIFEEDAAVPDTAIPQDGIPDEFNGIETSTQKIVANVDNDVSNGISTPIKNVTRVGKTLRRKFPGFTSLDLDSSTSEVFSNDLNINIDDNSLEDTTTTANPYEKTLRDALHLIRSRSHKRSVVINSSSVAPTKNHNDTHVTAASSTTQCQGNTSIPELASSSGSGSSNSVPLPLHPAGDNKSLIPATKFDSRLLSPQVDVRETIAGSANEMFRPASAPGDMTNQEGPNFTRLELATPVLSQIAGASMDTSTMDTSTMNTSTMNTSTMNTSVGNITSFTVVPSSPAPGHLTVCNVVTSEKGSNASDDVDVTSAMQTLKISDLQAAEVRKTNLELERRWRREAEVEKGVEQVLLAILDQAEKLSDGNVEQMAEDDMVDRAFASFFGSYSKDYQGSSAKMRPIRKLSEEKNEEEDSELYSGEPSSDTTLELLTEAHDCRMVSTATGKSSNDDLPPLAPQPSDESKRGTPTIDNSAHIQQEADTYVESIEIEDSDKSDGLSSCIEADATKDKADKNDMVLGRLSKETGGTTGVVLHSDDDTETATGSISDPNHCSTKVDPIAVDEDEDSTTIEKPQENPEHKEPGEIYPAVSGESSLCSIHDHKHDDRAFGDVTTNMVRALYAHLLKSVEKESGKGLSGWFKSEDSTHSIISDQLKISWNDNDPDEPGYIIHTFSKSQLQKVEHEFEMIMKEVKQKSSHNAAISPENDDDLQRNASLEVDLEEAESLLEKDEADDESTCIENRETADTENTSEENEKAMLADPSFPNAKAAGTGEVGDLEIYHLPIVYKAHQTGFEPTKDLVLQPDTIFAGKYYVQGELGSAAFSTAYRCVDLNSGKTSEDGETYYDEVCLKVIKNTKDFFDQSLDEIKILELLRQTKKCHDHNILEMKTFFYHKEHLIIVTELLRQNLFEFGKYVTDNDEPRYFTRHRLCYIARQCLVALDFIHNLGLVHSDIKPENILLASYSRARVKVIDFGSSCYLSDRQSSYIQSRSYRAPEVILGLPYDGKIDIWSLGCVIAEMYTGLVIFQNDSLVSMLSRIEAICGAFPEHMIANGRQSGQFFTPNGLLYEKIDVDDESEIRMVNSSNFEDDCSSSRGDDSLFHVFQPKRTTIAARLGYDEDFMSKRRNTWEDEEIAVFIDFLEQLLTIDPSKRLTAAEALQHPWIRSGLNYTEDDLKYPPEEDK